MPPAEAGRVLVVPENVQAFEDATALPGDQLRIWLACQAVVAERLFSGVPWLRDHLHGLVGEIARQTEPDSSGLMDRLQSLDMAQPERLQELLEGGEGLLGPPSAALQARLPALARIEAAVGRRLADPEGPQQLLAGLLRADPERAGGGRGEAFCREVLAATDIDGLARVWAHPDFLPAAEELAVPGRWLGRVGLVGGEEVDLDEGLRALLEGEGGEPGPDEPGGDGEE